MSSSDNLRRSGVATGLTSGAPMCRSFAAGYRNVKGLFARHFKNCGQMRKARTE